MTSEEMVNLEEFAIAANMENNKLVKVKEKRILNIKRWMDIFTALICVSIVLILIKG